MAEISLLELQDSGGPSAVDMALGFVLPPWESPDYPAEADVRLGVAYAMAGMEGTLGPYVLPLDLIDATPVVEAVDITPVVEVIEI